MSAAATPRRIGTREPISPQRNIPSSNLPSEEKSGDGATSTICISTSPARPMNWRDGQTILPLPDALCEIATISVCVACHGNPSHLHPYFGVDRVRSANANHGRFHLLPLSFLAFADLPYSNFSFPARHLCALGRPPGVVTYKYDNASPEIVPPAWGVGFFTISKPAVGKHTVVLSYPAQSDYASAAPQTVSYTCLVSLAKQDTSAIALLLPPYTWADMVKWRSFRKPPPAFPTRQQQNLRVPHPRDVFVFVASRYLLEANRSASAKTESAGSFLPSC
jgi:hypothetical protein